MSAISEGYVAVSGRMAAAIEALGRKRRPTRAQPAAGSGRR